MTGSTPTPDHYTLDDTLAGRAAQAAAVGILTALPDYLKTKAGLTVGYLTGLAGFGGLVAYANAEREDSPAAQGGTNDAPLDTAGDSFLLLAVVLGIAVLSALPGVAISRKLTAALAKRGIAKPWSVLGAVAAALTFAVSEAEARGLEKRAA